MKASEFINEGWSQKYKSSINCSHPKGFSQKAHCAGKKKHNESVETEMVCEMCGMCETHGNHMMETAERLDAKCWKGMRKAGTKIKGGVRVNNCVPNESIAEDDDAVAAFVARGGEIQQLKPQRGPKRSGVSLASKHIGSGSGRGTTKGKVSGLGANTGKSGKPVVTAEQSMAEGSGESYIIVRTDSEGKKDVFAGNFDTYEKAQKELDGLLAHPLHTKYKQKFEIKRKGGEQGVAEGICSLEEAHEIFDDFERAMAARGLTEDVFETITDEQIIRETAAWRRKEGKSAKGGLNRKGVASYRRENPGSKLQMAVTTKPSKLKPGSKAAKRRKSFCARMSGVKGPMKKPNGKPTRKALALRKWNC